MTSPQLESKIAGLDTLRGIAVLSVLVFHLYQSYFRGYILFDNQTGINVFPAHHPVFLHFLNEFHIGVTLFFIISGYLIHRLYAHKFFSFPNTVNFYQKRLLRILPAYYVSILVAIAGGLIISKGFPKITDLVLHFLCMQNFSDEYSFGIQAVYWSIAVEVQFYLFYALFRLMKDTFQWKISLTQVFFLMLFISIIAKIYFYYSTSDLNVLKLRLLDNTLLRFPEWLLGAVIFEKQAFFAKISQKILIGLVLIIVSIGISDWFLTNYFLCDILYALAFGLILCQTLQVSFENRFLDFIGKISYTFYLYHFLIYSIWDVSFCKILHLPREANLPRFFIMLSSIPVVIFVSYGLYRLIEKQALTLKDKLNSGKERRLISE